MLWGNLLNFMVISPTCISSIFLAYAGMSQLFNSISWFCSIGDGMGELSLADRATIANMSPEYGATMGFFPVDHVTLQYLKLTGRSDETVSMNSLFSNDVKCLYYFLNFIFDIIGGNDRGLSQGKQIVY